MGSTAEDVLDGISTSVAVKAPCIAVITANNALSGLQSYADGDRVLCVGQTNTVDNGVYEVSSGQWQRTKDFDGNRDAVQGTRVLVRSASVDGIEYELLTANPVIIGTSQLVFALRYGANATFSQNEQEAAAAVVPTSTGFKWFNVKRYGALGNGATDDRAAILRAILAASVATAAGTLGATVFFPTGKYPISSMITMPNRVALVGENNRTSEIVPHSTFASSYMLNAVNGTSSMFGSFIQGLHIDARGKNMTAVIWAQAWQESCGLKSVVIQYNGTTPTGVLLTDGYGGAQGTCFEDLEMFTDSTAVNDIGIDCQQISSAGAFKLNLVRCTINGSVANPISKCVRMVNDSLIAVSFHSEYSAKMFSMEGAGFLDVSGMTGSSNSTVDMITLASTFSGTVKASNLYPNGATGLIVDNNVEWGGVPIVGGKDIIASGAAQNIPLYVFPETKFSAVVGADISNVTGNNTAYTVIFGTERFDEWAEYNHTTGIFTAKRSGKFLFNATVRLNLPSGSTSVLVNIATTGQDNYIWRGGADNIKDSGSNVVLSGSVLVELTVGQTARVIVTVGGIGANTVDVLQTDSVFSGQWVGR